MPRGYLDRAEAGQALAEAVAEKIDESNVIVLALPRGGVPIGREVADKLGAALDVMLVRKLGVPGHEELAFGAVASGDVRVLNEDVVRSVGINEDTIEQVAEKQLDVLHTQAREIRGDRKTPDLSGRTVILVDDGVATGATMRAAMQAAQQQDAKRVIIAVPVAPPQTVSQFEKEADEVICPLSPEPFGAVGAWYKSFAQVTTDEVRETLRSFAASS